MRLTKIPVFRGYVLQIPTKPGPKHKHTRFRSSNQAVSDIWLMAHHPHQQWARAEGVNFRIYSTDYPLDVGQARQSLEQSQDHAADDQAGVYSHEAWGSTRRRRKAVEKDFHNRGHRIYTDRGL
jgi:hypothetical protein